MNDAVEDMAGRAYSPRTMSRTFSVCALVCGSLLLSGHALAQMYPGEGISVNPAYGGAPAMYPGAHGPYSGTIHLHLPVHHAVVHHKKPAADVATATPAAPASSNVFPALPPDTQTTAPAPADATPAPVPHKSKHAKAEAAAQPAPVQPPPAETGLDNAIPLALDPTEPIPVAKPAPHRQHAQASAPQTQMASINPASRTAPAQDKADAGLSKRSEILFAHGETDPPAATINKMHVLAGDLNTLLGAGAQRVLLDAYGGQPGDKSSDARRISLKRALVVRQLLIENGVPSGSIDVRAMGGTDDSGAPDRVDVFVKA